MNKKRVTDYIPKAIDKINGEDYDRNVFSKMGAMIIMNGLLPAVAYYCKSDRIKYLNIVIEICDIDEMKNVATYLNSKNNEKPDIASINNNNDLKEKMLDAIIAIKLVLDAYSKNDEDSNNCDGEESNESK